MTSNLPRKSSGTLRIVFPLFLFVFCCQLYAGVVDLTTAGATDCTTVTNACFQQVPDQTTGTGVIQPFLRVQANGVEEGYNTSITAQYDEKAVGDNNFTHKLTLGEVPVVNFFGTDYRQFLLDINESKGGSNELLTLNKIQIFLRTADLANAVGANTAGAFDFTNFLTDNNQIFTMGNNTVELDFSLNPGSGAGDMFLYIANSLFSGYSNSTFVVLYSAFGIGHDTSDGIEEWAVLQGGPTTVVPEPTSVALFGTVLVGVGFWMRKRIGATV